MAQKQLPGKALAKKLSVPINQLDTSCYDSDDACAHMKQRFAAEMRRMDEEMAKFTTHLLHLHGQTTTVQTGVASSRETPATSWDEITKSPLVEGEGSNKMLKLKFDVREYALDEISVKVLNNTLLVSAVHHNNSEGSRSEYKEFHREFLLPVGTDPKAVESSLSKDGVLTVQAPLQLKNVESESAVEYDNERDDTNRRD